MGERRVGKWQSFAKSLLSLKRISGSKTGIIHKMLVIRLPQMMGQASGARVRLFATIALPMVMVIAYASIAISVCTIMGGLIHLKVGTSFALVTL